MTIIKRTSKPTHRRERNAFTLVELLVVLTVMVALSGMLTYALRSAQTDARIKRTQSDVISLGQLLQTRMNEVALSKMNLVYGPTATNFNAPATGPTAPPAPNASSFAQLVNFEANERARVILLARRDMMRMVLPECQADLIYPPVSIQFRTRSAAASSLTSNVFNPNVAQLKPPTEWTKMRTKIGLFSAEKINFEHTNDAATDPTIDAIREASNPDYEAILRQDSRKQVSAANPRPPIDWTREHEASECLYLILSTTELFGKNAIDQIPSSKIQDTDQDGVPEILDAWDQPYEFIRNPVGLRSPAIKNFDPSGATELEQFPEDPDPLDLLLVDFRYSASFHPGGNPYTTPNPFFPIYVPPVVMSSGQDRAFGIRRTYSSPNEGVMASYSSSVVEISGNNIGPLYPGFTSFRYPDPFFNVASMPITATGLHQLSQDGLRLAKTGDGLGATINRETAADNITSLDAGF